MPEKMLIKKIDPKWSDGFAEITFDNTVDQEFSHDPQELEILCSHDFFSFR